MISIEIWIRNTLLQKFLQTDMIFFDQLIVSSIKFGKCFAEFQTVDITSALKQFSEIFQTSSAKTE